MKKLLLTLTILLMSATWSQAAISVVGTPQTGNANNGGTVTLTWSTTPSEGDYTVVIVGSPAATPADCSMVTTGYTRLAYYTGAAAANPTMAIFYKKQGASPDSNAQTIADGSAATDTSAIGFVLRGVDQTTFSDQTPTTAGETTSENPDPAQIVTQTDGAYVIVAALMIVLKDTAITDPSGYTGYSQVGDDTNDHTLAAAYKAVATATTENPASWTNWGSGLWYAITIAVKPAIVVTCDDDCTECADSGACSGSAQTCYWWGSPESCQATDDPCNSDCTECSDETACDASATTCYWYDATCNSEPQAGPPAKVKKHGGVAIGGVVIR